MKEAEMTELSWDKLLNIKTTGRDDSHSDQYKYPYEPTPYTVLERLANSGMIRKGDVLLDYGCGKGRVGFFLAYQTRCQIIGVEYDERIYAAAEKNRKSAISGRRVRVENINAELFVIPEEVNRIFFFNPFSVEILHPVLAKIRASYYRDPRELLLFFYYPSDEYVAFLMTQDELMLSDEIDCEDLFPGKNSRERILVFSIM